MPTVEPIHIFQSVNRVFKGLVEVDVDRTTDKVDVPVTVVRLVHPLEHSSEQIEIGSIRSVLDSIKVVP